MKLQKISVIAAAALVVAGFTQQARAERLKDIVDIKGVRINQLKGFGLVVGLNGTGDNSEVSKRMLTNALRKSGLIFEPDDMSSKNIAFVAITADLGPFDRTGAQIDVTVSAVGSASSLQGGTLLFSELFGADGQVYAVAQGPLAIGGYSVSGQSATVSKNHPTVGRIPSGATVEKEEIASFVKNGEIGLQLKNPDFGTAQRMAAVINMTYPDSSFAADAGLVRVKVPKELTKAELTGFIDKIGNMEVKVDFPAIIVINERTGTVIVGENVGISTVAISHGNLLIVTEEKDFVSQPAPFSETGTTEKTHRTDHNVKEEKQLLHVVPRQVSVSELARALNMMGLTPRDLISIFQQLKQAGALQAELKII